MKQTAVDWLVEQYTQGNYSWEVYEQAKQIEKEQIKEAIIKGEENIDIDGCYENPNLSDQYYNETYDL